MMTLREGWSLRRAFARLLLLTAFLPALVFGVITVANQHMVDRADVAERLATSARITAGSIDDYLDSRLASVALLADMRRGGSPSWSDDLAALHARYPDFVTVLVTDADGRMVAVHPASRLPAGASLDVSDREYFRVPREQGRPHVSDAFRGRGVGSDALVAVSAPLVDADGRFAGVVEGSIQVDTFTKRRGEAFRARGYEFLLVDGAGQTVYSTQGLGLDFLDPVTDHRLLEPGASARSAYQKGLLVDGDGGYVASAGIGDDWRLVLVAHEAPLLDALAGRGLLLLGLLALVSLGVLAASWRQMRQLALSTGELLRMLRGYALGDRLPADGLARLPVELRPIAGAIEDLAGRLTEAYGGLNEALDKQRALAASLRTAVATREIEIRDRTEELRTAVEQLDRISRTDALTGCLNYRGLEETLQSLRDVPQGERGELSVLALDIDHFKAYNDHYGHQQGDNALRRFAGVVRSVLYHPDDSFARSGGEEFVVLLPGTNLDQAVAIAERVREGVRHAEIPHERHDAGVLTVSVGVAHAPPGGADDPDQLLRRADEALYRAKQAGRDRVST